MDKRKRAEWGEVGLEGRADLVQPTRGIGTIKGSDEDLRDEEEERSDRTGL